MRDSRIGSFGALALMLSLAARGTAIAAIGHPGRVAAALIAAAALARAGMILLPLLLSPARSDGLAAGLVNTDARRVAAGCALGVLPALVLLSFGAALRAISVALVAALAFVWLARRQVGGYTGDVLGAVAVTIECAALAAIGS
jgi:adenosylcobinamide-GDP ribazoletransferase